MRTTPVKITFLVASCVLVLSLASQATPLVFEGRIVPPDGRSVDQYTVYLEYHEGQRQTPPAEFRLAQQPDADGAFRMEAPPHSNQYWLFIQDHAGRTLIGYPHLNSSQDFGTIELRDDGELTGMLRTPENEPAANVRVLLERKLEARCRHYVPAGSTQSDPQGGFAFAQMHPGDYRLRIESEHYTHAAADLTVTEDIYYMELQLAPAASIRGRVTLPDGTPVEGVKVTTRGHTAPAITNAQGHYHIGGLGPDTYRLLASSENHAPKDFATLSVVLGRDDLTAPDIVVWPLGTLRVTLTPSAPEKPLPDNLSMALETRGERFSSRSPFDAPVQGGIAVFDGLPPGDFLFLLRNEELGDFQSEITITSDEVTEMAIELPEVFTLHGRAVDEEGAPLESARAMYHQTPSRQSMRFGSSHTRMVSRYARSDAEGRFSLKGLPSGEGSLTIEIENRVPHNETVNLPLESDEERLFTLDKGLSVIVRLVDDAGQPVPGVTLSLSPDHSHLSHQMTHHFGSSLRAESGEDGQATLQAVQAGRYRLSVNSPDHYGVFDPIEITDRTARLDDLVLQRGHEISGAVIDADGTPIAGARISAHSQSRSPDPRSYIWRNTETDENGVFRIGGLPEGTFHISVHDAQRHEELSSLSDVPAGSEDLMVILAPLHTITLYVIAPDDSPIAGAAVSVMPSSSYHRIGRMIFDFHDTGNMTDSDGATEIEVRGGSRYTIAAHLPPWVDATQTLDLSDARDVPESIVMRMQAGITVSGKVVDPDGTPRPGVYVTVEDRDAIQTDAQGSFEVPGVGPGVLVLLIHADIRQHPLAVHRMLIEDTATEMPPVHVTLPVPASISGTLRNAEGEPIPDATVMLNNMTDVLAGHKSNYETSTDSSGTFNFENIIPGSYMIIAIDDMHQRLTASILPVMRMIEVRAGETIVADLPETAVAGQTVSGRITRDGEPLSGMRVMFIPLDKDGKINMTAAMSMMSREPPVTDADGRYTAKQLQPGQYLALVASDVEVHPFDAQGSQQAVTVAIAEGQSELDIATDGTTLHGIVTGTDGKPASGVQVVVAPAAVDIIMHDMISRTTETGPDGRFEIPDLIAGRLSITAVDELREEAATMIIVLEADAELAHAIQLAPGQRIEGRIHREPQGSMWLTFVMAFTEDGSLIGGGEVEEDGEFALESVLPQGRYFVACLDKELVATGQFVEAGADTPLTFTLRPGGDVAVRLTGDPELIADRTLRVTDADGNIIQRMTSSFDMGYITSMTRTLSLLPTEADGQTTIYGLPAGTYTIGLVDSDVQATVTVEPFAQATLELAIE